MAAYQNKPNLVVIHCSATKADQDFSAQDIDRWHRQRGFLEIGYHWVIRRDGTVQKGRDDSKFGAHAKGYNRNTIGVCLIGGVDANGKAKRNFTDEQYAALRQVLIGIQDVHGVTRACGHRDLPNVVKDCPSFSVEHWLRTECNDIGYAFAVLKGLRS